MLLNLTLILFINIMFSPGKFVSSCIYKAVGDKVVIPFDGASLPAYNELKWTHNQTRVYYKKGSQIKNSELNIDQHGSLVLENVQKDKSGEYRGITYDADGSLIKETVQQLCVQEPVPEPTVLVECVEKGVNLTCSAVNDKSMVVSWMKNSMKANVTRAVLYVNSSELKSGDNFSCTVSNKISQTSAKEVEPVCSDTGLDLWSILVVLTGGGILMLFIICLVCVCRGCRQNKRKAEGEEQHQPVSFVPDYIYQPDDQQKLPSTFGYL